MIRLIVRGEAFLFFSLSLGLACLFFLQRCEFELLFQIYAVTLAVLFYIKVFSML